MNSKLLLIIVILILVGGALLTFTGNSTQSPVTQNETSETEAVNEMPEEGEDEEMMDSGTSEDDDTMVEEEVSGEMELASAGTYEPYDSNLLSNAQEGDVILFFKASWCPSCRALDANIKNNLDDIPEDVTILEVDYDSSTELRKKYSVTTQHTLVQVDAEGNLVQKWTGSPTLNSLISKL